MSPQPRAFGPCTTSWVRPICPSFEFLRYLLTHLLKQQDFHAADDLNAPLTYQQSRGESVSPGLMSTYGILMEAEQVASSPCSEVTMLKP